MSKYISLKNILFSTWRFTLRRLLGVGEAMTSASDPESRSRLRWSFASGFDGFDGFDTWGYLRPVARHRLF